MHKIKPLRLIGPVAAFWVLVNLFWGLLLCVIAPSLWGWHFHGWLHMAYAFSGVALVSLLTETWLHLIFFCLWSVPFGAFLLRYWLKKRTRFKAFLLAALGPYLGLPYLILYPVFTASIFWTVGTLVAYGLIKFFINLDRPLREL